MAVLPLQPNVLERQVAVVCACLEGAELIKSEAGRHEYAYDASKVKLIALLDQAAAHTQILDVETHRADIDDVIADIYEKWEK